MNPKYFIIFFHDVLLICNIRKLWKQEQISYDVKIGNLMGIYSGLIFLILFGRASLVFPLSALANYMNRRSEQTTSITFEHQVISTCFI
jgi:predicted ferric reductase